MRIAITGGTGFVGSHLIELALAEGHQVRALTRRPQEPQTGVTWIEGALDTIASLDALCEGSDAVIHVAGVINGSAQEFYQGNVVGTQNMLAAATNAGIGRFVHISSLSAREPELSAYGRSKLESEAPVIAAAMDWTIIRPAAIYGPRDRLLLDLFRFARRGVLPLPPGGQMSVIHVRDLCRLMLACLSSDLGHGRTFEPDDGREGGWGTVEFARALGRAVNRRVLPLPLPKTLLLIGARIDRLIRGSKAQLTRDRVNYFCHPDWAAAPHARPPADLWLPHIPTEEGLAATARWYKAQGWL
jgi:nucleoside-diphosphate-sugar epimerase